MCADATPGLTVATPGYESRRWPWVPVDVASRTRPSSSTPPAHFSPPSIPWPSVLQDLLYCCGSATVRDYGRLHERDCCRDRWCQCLLVCCDGLSSVQISMAVLRPCHCCDSSSRFKQSRRVQTTSTISAMLTSWMCSCFTGLQHERARSVYADGISSPKMVPLQACAPQLCHAHGSMIIDAGIQLLSWQYSICSKHLNVSWVSIFTLLNPLSWFFGFISMKSFS